MIQMTLKIVATEDTREEMVRTLRSIVGPTRAQAGCLSVQFLEDAQEENVLVLLGEWVSRGDLDHYVLSEEFRKILAVVDMASEPPEIKFDTVSHTGGMDIIEATLGEH